MICWVIVASLEHRWKQVGWGSEVLGGGVGGETKQGKVGGGGGGARPGLAWVGGGGVGGGGGGGGDRYKTKIARSDVSPGLT